jgi:hypothetical protein
MRNELRSRLQYALETSEQRRLALRTQLEQIIKDEDRPQEGGRPMFEGARERDKVEHELELAEEWCSATRALNDWLAGELLGDPQTDGEGDNFYNRPQLRQELRSRTDEKALR